MTNPTQGHSDAGERRLGAVRLVGLIVLVSVSLIVMACSVDRGTGPEAGVTLQKQESPKIVDIDMTIGSDGLPLVVYRQSDDIKVLHCNDPECVSWTLVPALDQGISVSAAIASDELPLIAYISPHPVRNNELLAKVAHCLDAECREYATSVIADARSVSVASGSDGLGILSYVTEDNLLAFATASISIAPRQLPQWHRYPVR